MGGRLFLLDGMALVYRAHFAFVRNPIVTSAGMNTSAIFGFANTLLEILEKREPTQIAVAFDTSAPTPRHERYPEYKAQRAEMPEELSAAIPHVKRLIEALRIPILVEDGYEADDVIGTLALQAEKADPELEILMVTPDKDFAQLVTERAKLFKPGRQGSEVEILTIDDVRRNWEVEEPAQVIDILGLWGDASDNIPGVPGIGEKTAKKLIGKYGSIENLLDHVSDLKGKQKENVEANAEQALLSKELATIILDAPVSYDPKSMEIQPRDDDELKALFVEFEFNALGRRLFGDAFKAGRSASARARTAESSEAPAEQGLKTLAEVPHEYHLVETQEARKGLIAKLAKLERFCLDTETSSLDPRTAQVIGLSFAWQRGEAYYVALPRERAEAEVVLSEFAEVLGRKEVEIVGHNLKFDLLALRWHGIEVRGKVFDTMLAHTLVRPELRHNMDFMAEAMLGYTPVPISSLIGERKRGVEQVSMLEIMDDRKEELAEYAAEDADVTFQLSEELRPLLKEEAQERVFYEVEAPLVPVLASMEREGITLDPGALMEIRAVLESQLGELRERVFRLAGEEFNLNSPKQLGEVLFDKLKLVDKPKKTRTGQYKTDEQVLSALALQHEIVADILAYREAAKLKNTYVDALPETVHPVTGRVHTQYDQLMTATGRLASNHPNLQNIPIRTDMGREIRKAFVPRGKDFCLLSADYSQIELRVMASLSGDEGLREAFNEGLDIHTATAARVYGVGLDDVIPEMRRTAKMVNFGIIYGITGFGLAQRLGISRQDSDKIIEEYFHQYGGVKSFMGRTIEFAKEHGYVETVTGRRRYLRDIQSKNWTLRQAAERTAINTPVQGTAADMIKLAMVRVDEALCRERLETRMLLQVHDELVFDLKRDEEEVAIPLIVRCMKEALPLEVPIVVETGTGENWLEAH